MRHFLFNGQETPEEIRRILGENSEGKEDVTYPKYLTEEELTQVREAYTNRLVEVEEFDEELATAKKVHKDAVAPLKAENKEDLRTLRKKYKEVNESVWKMQDFKGGMIELVNDRGEVVSSRRMKPEEKQGNVFNMRARAVNE